MGKELYVWQHSLHRIADLVEETLKHGGDGLIDEYINDGDTVNKDAYRVEEESFRDFIEWVRSMKSKTGNRSQRVLSWRPGAPRK